MFRLQMFRESKGDWSGMMSALNTAVAELFTGQLDNIYQKCKHIAFGTSRAMSKDFPWF